jgi:hypothetical protein
MLLELFNIINNITPVLSTTTQTTITLYDNKINSFANILLISKLILLIISTSYFAYLYYYQHHVIKKNYIPYILVQYAIIIILLSITFSYASYKFFTNPPKKI